MEWNEYKQTIDIILSGDMSDIGRIRDFYALVKEFEREYPYYSNLLEADMGHVMSEYLEYARRWAAYNASQTGDVYMDSLCDALGVLRAHYSFEAYLQVMESKRSPQKRFYEPREGSLKVLVDELQNLDDGKYKFLGISLPPRVGKSTICIFFLTWVMGKRPNSHSAMSGHSGILADGFYSEALNLIGTDEYRFSEIFPHAQIEHKSAEKKEINLDRPDRFATLTCRGIDGTFTGAVDISSDGYLYVDDLVRDREESLSPARLDKRYQDYLNVLVDRKNDGAKELMVGTRWNVLDPLGRVEKDKANDPAYKFLRVPALNEDGESNFKYKYGVGFSTEYYEDIRSRLDKNEWEAKYQQHPFVREGLLYPEDELRYFNGIMPDGDYRTVAACDVAFGGGDSLSMPIAREYPDGSVYVYDWIFTNKPKEVSIPLVVGGIMKNDIRRMNFESNNGGSLYRDLVDEQLTNNGYKCATSDSRAPATMAKMEKIIAYSGDIKRKYYFLDYKHRPEMYKKAMDEVNMFVQIGKNEHDDAVDGLTQLEMFIEGAHQTTPTVVGRRFF